MSRSPHITHRGASLVEMILSMSILVLLMAITSRIMIFGYDYYWTAIGSLDVQKAALLANRRLSADLALSNIKTVSIDTNGIVFASPLDANGVPRYTSDGNVIWQSHVCYYLETTPTESRLIRKETPVGTPGPNPPLPLAEGHSVASFASRPNPQLVATGIVDLTATIDVDVVNLAITGSTNSRGVFEMTLRNRAFTRN